MPTVRFALLFAVCAVLATGLPAALPAAEVALDQARITLSGEASAQLGPAGLDLHFDRTDARVILQPANDAAWDFSTAAQLAFDVENRSAERHLRLNLRVSSGSNELVGGIALAPGERRVVRLGLPPRWAFAPPKGVRLAHALDPQRITALECFMQWPFEASAPGIVDCRIAGIRSEGVPAAPPAEHGFLPFVDGYGQYVHGDWPEKVKRDSDLTTAFATEKAELDAVARPEQWNEYGGWKNGPQLAATGSFRTEKVGGKWFLVDPTGRLFFSHGIDVLRAHTDAMKTRGREDWFAELPAGANDWQPVERNLQVKYGTTDYQPAFHATLEQRLLHWGMNSIGDWAADGLIAQGRTPYTLQLTDYNWKMPHIGKLKLYDVYDPAYVERMAGLLSSEVQRSEVAKRSLTDPYCIGYFIDNELAWGRDGQLADELFKCPATQAAKVELLRWLKTRHATIDALNAAWGTSYASWEALLTAREAPVGTQHRSDTDAFAGEFADRYFTLARDAVKRGAPQRLYLGARFVGTDAVKPWLATACARHSDVLSVNIYAHTPANFPVIGYPDIPVLIGEFHFGVPQRGMASPGLALAGVDDADRAMAYTRFVQGALAHPLIVGAHWFQFRDQPLLGRGDGESYQIGFVDVADTPYLALGAAARRIGETMYATRMASAAPAAKP